MLSVGAECTKMNRNWRNLKMQKLVWILFLFCEPRVTDISGGILSPWDLGWRERLSVGEASPMLDSQLETWGSLSINIDRGPKTVVLDVFQTFSCLHLLCWEVALYSTPFTLEFGLGFKGLSVIYLKKRGVMVEMITLTVFGKTDLQNHLNRRI